MAKQDLALDSWFILLPIHLLLTPALVIAFVAGASAQPGSERIEVSNTTDYAVRKLIYEGSFSGISRASGKLIAIDRELLTGLDIPRSTPSGLLAWMSRPVSINYREAIRSDGPYCISEINGLDVTSVVMGWYWLEAERESDLMNDIRSVMDSLGVEFQKEHFQIAIGELFCRCVFSGDQAIDGWVRGDPFVVP